MTRMNRLTRLARVGRFPIRNRMPRLASFTTSTNRNAIATRLNRADRAPRMARIPWLTILIRIWLTNKPFLRRLNWVARTVRRKSATRKTSISCTTMLP